MARSTGEPPARGPRLGLLELMILVGVAGASIGLARRAVKIGLADGVSIGTGAGGIHNYDRAVATAMVVLLCWVILPLVRGAKQAALEGGTWRNRAWPVAWRCVAAVALAATILGLMDILRLPPLGRPRPVTWPPMNWFEETAREASWPVLAILSAFGTAAAILPVGPRPARPRPMRWAMVPLALLAGALLMAVLADLPYLILIAVDGVTTALSSRSGRALPDVHMRGTPALNARIARAGWEALASGLAISACGSLLAQDLRRDLSAEPAKPLAMAARFALAVIVAFAGWRMLYVTLPMLHPSLFEGLGYLIEPSDAFLIVAAFATLSIGLAARSVTPSPTVAPRGILTHWIGPARGLALCGLGLAVAGSVGFAATLVRPYDLDALPRLREAQQAMARAWDAAFSLPVLRPTAPYMRFDLLAYGVALLWLAWLVFQANRCVRSATRSPLDQVLASRSRIAWFAWGAVGLTVVCLAALPTLYLSGLSLMHVRLHSLEFFGVDLDL